MDWILAQRRDISGTIDEIWTKSAELTVCQFPDFDDYTVII